MAGWKRAGLYVCRRPAPLALRRWWRSRSTSNSPSSVFLTLVFLVSMSASGLQEVYNLLKGRRDHKRSANSSDLVNQPHVNSQNAQLNSVPVRVNSLRYYLQTSQLSQIASLGHKKTLAYDGRCGFNDRRRTATPPTAASSARKFLASDMQTPPRNSFVHIRTRSSITLSEPSARKSCTSLWPIRTRYEYPSRLRIVHLVNQCHM